MFPAGNYMSKLTIETLVQGVKYVQSIRQWRRFGIFIANFEHISHLVVVLLLLTLSIYSSHPDYLASEN